MNTFLEDIKNSKITSVPNERAIGLSVVRAGTSRITVIDAETIEEGRSAKDVADVVLGSGHAYDGLGGTHYQLNKVGIYQTFEDDSIGFRYFNLDPTLQKVVAGAECGHAAAAVAADVCIRKPDRFNPTLVHMKNLGTNQVVECSLHSGDLFWDSSCTLRFCNQRNLMIPGGGHPDVVMDSGCSVAYEIVIAGNIFVAVENQHACSDVRVRNELEDIAIKMAAKFKESDVDASHIRILPFNANWHETFRGRISASCFNGPQMHHSLPVSGSIALAELLSSRQIARLDPAELAGLEEVNFQIDVQSKASREPATVRFIPEGDEWSIESATYDTSVRVLFYGLGILPS